MQRKLLHTRLFSTVLLLSGCEDAQRKHYEFGRLAYEAGDHATALKEFLPLAIHGETDAQCSLGIIYQEGKGVPQEQEDLELCARARSRPARLVERARIVLLAAAGKPDKEIAAELGMTAHKAARWRTRFLDLECRAWRRTPRGPGARVHLAGAGETNRAQNNPGQARQCYSLVNAHDGLRSRSQ
jgi:TPR repeat protein